MFIQMKIHIIQLHACIKIVGWIKKVAFCYFTTQDSGRHLYDLNKLVFLRKWMKYQMFSGIQNIDSSGLYRYVDFYIEFIVS